jgi:hypothetical protein
MLNMEKRLYLFLIILVAIVFIIQSRTVRGVENSNKAGLNNYSPDTTNKSRLEHSEAFVTVTFDGLMVLSFNDKGQAEVKVVKNEHHKLSMEIREISPTGASTSEYPINRVEDLWIGATSTATKGVTVYTNPQVAFNRKRDQGDPEDFRWILDMEGSELHKTKLGITHPEKLTPTLHFTHGVFYTHELSEKRASRIELNTNKQPKMLGKVPEKIAVDIYLDDGSSGVALSAEGNGAAPLMLTRKPGTRYEIIVKNLPHNPAQCRRQGRSHFSYYYEAIHDRSGKQFDLEVIEENKSSYSAKSLVNSFLDGSYFISASRTPAAIETNSLLPSSAYCLPDNPLCTVVGKGKPPKRNSKYGIEDLRYLQDKK